MKEIKVNVVSCKYPEMACTKAIELCFEKQETVFVKCTEDEFYCMLGSNPPRRMRDCGFVCGEAYSSNLYECYYKASNTYFCSLQTVKMFDDTYEQLQKQGNKITEFVF